MLLLSQESESCHASSEGSPARQNAAGLVAFDDMQALLLHAAAPSTRQDLHHGLPHCYRYACI